nr:MAG TPA: hypothetical protein [Podoviridae sp. ctY3D12]
MESGSKNKKSECQMDDTQTLPFKLSSTRCNGTLFFKT